jgi:AraC-like DNA-binding protein
MRGPAPAAATPEPVIPDGCVELVLNFGDPFRRHQDHRSETQPVRLLAGQLTQAVNIAPTGVIDLWGIRFHPWGAATFLGVSGVDLRDRMLPLDVLGAVDVLLARAFDASSDAERMELILAALQERVARTGSLDPRLPALARLATEGGVVTVKGLSSIAGISVRRVQTLFAASVGLSPKELMRIARFQRAMALARGDSSMSLGRVASECGYFDHAHLVRDARRIVGLAPSAIVPGMGPLTGFFITAPVPAAA